MKLFSFGRLRSRLRRDFNDGRNFDGTSASASWVM